MCPNDKPPTPATNNKVATLIFCWVNRFISGLQETSFIAEKWHVSSPGTFAILKSSLSPLCFLCSPLTQPGLKIWWEQKLLEVLISTFFPAFFPSHSWLFSTYLEELCSAPSAETVQIIQTVETNRCLSRHPTEHLRDVWNNSSSVICGERYASLQMDSASVTLPSEEWGTCALSIGKEHDFIPECKTLKAYYWARLKKINKWTSEYFCSFISISANWSETLEKLVEPRDFTSTIMGLCVSSRRLFFSYCVTMQRLPELFELLF